MVLATPSMFVVFVITGAALALLVTEVLPPDTVAIGVAVTLVALEPWTGVGLAGGLSGFANPATLTVLAMFVLSEGVRRTGVIRRLSVAVVRFTGGDVRRLFLAVLGLGGLPAGLINNTPLVAVLVPLVTDLANRHDISPSKLLIPLSYVAMLGGTVTLVGTSSNLLASELSSALIGRSIGLFEFTGLGLLVLAVGCVYLFTVGRRLLPARVPPAVDLVRSFELDAYLTRLVVTDASPIAGESIQTAIESGPFDVDILQLSRGDGLVVAPRPDQTLRAGDVLTVRASERARDAFAEAAALRPVRRGGATERTLPRGHGTLASVLVPPESSLVGTALATTRIRARYATSVLAIRRADGTLLREGLEPCSFEAGDTVLVYAPPETITFWRATDELVLLGTADGDGLAVSDAEADLYRGDKTPVALGILAAVLVAAATGVVPLVVAALAGVVVAVATGVVTPREGYAAVDWQVVFLLAGMFPLGLALDASGGAAFFASLVAEVSAGLPSPVVLAGCYLLTVALTNAVSNAVSVVFMIPVAVDTASQIGADPFSFVLAVTFAASTSFMTPIGYQTNLMVVGPGGYRFVDFVRVGAPLQALLTVVVTAGIVLFWGL